VRGEPRTNFQRPGNGTAVDVEVSMAKSHRRQDDTASPQATERDELRSLESGSDADDNLSDRVAARAYELYQARGGGDGQAWDDWLAAERELAPPGQSRK
jgi:DUF2934 family protein